MPGRAFGFLRAATAVIVAMPAAVSEVGVTDIVRANREWTFNERKGMVMNFPSLLPPLSSQKLLYSEFQEFLDPSIMIMML